MAFDTDLLLKDPQTEKVLFKTVDGELKRFSSKIIKMDENNHYVQAMTKPLPFGCIKKKENVLTLTELTDFLRSVTLEDPIGRMLTVDIEFFDINAKTLLFNKIIEKIFRKKQKG